MEWVVNLPYQQGIALAQKLSVCVLCHHQPMSDGLLCEGCEKDINWLPKPFVIETQGQQIAVQMATFYTGAMARTISAFKDKERLDALPFLVHCVSKLADSLADLDEAVILPIPTTDDRLVERGFYPVGILAEYLSAMTGFECYQGVVRVVDGVRQRGLDRQARLSNLSGAFMVEYLPDVDTVILFDDVSTTGATFLEVAGVLLDADPALSIVAVCLAHGSPNYHQKSTY